MERAVGSRRDPGSGLPGCGAAQRNGDALNFLPRSRRSHHTGDLNRRLRAESGTGLADRDKNPEHGSLHGAAFTSISILLDGSTAMIRFWQPAFSRLASSATWSGTILLQAQIRYSPGTTPSMLKRPSGSVLTLC